jgi:hypothetical protein
MKEVDGLSFILIDLNVPVLAPHLIWIETILHFSEKITLFAVCGIHTSSAKGAK